MRRGPAVWLLAAGIAIVVALALVVSPFASSSPDGLERVAIDEGFDDTATDHAAARSPLADYETEGVEGNAGVGLAGLAGVAITVIAFGALVLVLRRFRPTAARDRLSPAFRGEPRR